jgi:hypothetical protein
MSAENQKSIMASDVKNLLRKLNFLDDLTQKAILSR